MEEHCLRSIMSAVESSQEASEVGLTMSILCMRTLRPQEVKYLDHKDSERYSWSLNIGPFVSKAQALSIVFIWNGQAQRWAYSRQLTAVVSFFSYSEPHISAIDS